MPVVIVGWRIRAGGDSLLYWLKYVRAAKESFAGLREMERNAKGPTRREMILGGGVMLSGLVMARASSQQTASKASAAAASGGDKRTALHQEVELKGSPKRIYEILTNSKQFSACTGAPAEIKTGEGGSFSLFGGQITGRNIELVPGVRVVQAWRPGDWPVGVYSLVKFELKAAGAGTKVILDHSSFPAGGYEHLGEGWKSHYFEPMAKYLG
jgi:activator of HSP90 ATPase